MAKTNAERQAKWRERMHEAGWKPLTVWVSHEALEVLKRYPIKERGTIISQAVVGWKGNVTSDVTNNLPDNIQPESVTSNVIHNVTDNLAGLRSLAGTGEYRAALVKEAQRLHAEGRSFEVIARMWNAEQIQTLSGNGHWHGKTLSRLV